MTFCYSLYNLTVQSELPLPAPACASPNGNSSPVTISFGSVDKNGLASPMHQAFAWQSDKTDFWLNVPSVARFLISSGQCIVIDPVRDIDDDSVRTFLLGTCMEVLLRQRQLTVLPGFALKLGDYGVSFTGGSALGLAMLQALFYRQGYSFPGGNYIALTDKGDILPGISQLECTPPVLAALQLDKQVLKPVRPNIKKYIIPLAEQYHPRPLRCKLVYTLKMHQQADIRFEELNDDQKQFCLQKLLAANHLPVELWHDQPPSLPMQIIRIHLPVSGLKLQQLADCIKEDVMERGYSYV